MGADTKIEPRFEEICQARDYAKKGVSCNFYLHCIQAGDAAWRPTASGYAGRYYKTEYLFGKPKIGTTATVAKCKSKPKKKTKKGKK